MNKVILYGMGKKGAECAKGISRNADILQIEVVAFMDKRDVDLGEDYPVCQPDRLCQLVYDFIVVTSVEWYQCIKEELHDQYGIDHEKIILWRELLSAEGVTPVFYCNCCIHYVPYMISAGYSAPVFEKVRVAGGGVRHHAKCPYCGSVDRNRFVEYVLETKTDIYQNLQADILHFAPEDMIEMKLRKEHSDYITADIRPIADVVEDITQISFSDQKFDYIICNHIMQDVPEDTKAFFELKRCIKKNGKIIFSVPICWDQKTCESAGHGTSEERLRFYGQKEHVRLYGNDLEERLRKYGFHITVYRAADELNCEQIQQMSLIPDDTVWVLEKERGYR